MMFKISAIFFFFFKTVHSETGPMVFPCKPHDNIAFSMSPIDLMYCQSSNIRGTLGYKIVDHSDVVGASPLSAAPTTSSFST